MGRLARSLQRECCRRLRLKRKTAPNDSSEQGDAEFMFIAKRQRKDWKGLGSQDWLASQNPAMPEGPGSLEDLGNWPAVLWEAIAKRDPFDKSESAQAARVSRLR